MFHNIISETISWQPVVCPLNNQVLLIIYLILLNNNTNPPTNNAGASKYKSTNRPSTAME